MLWPNSAQSIRRLNYGVGLTMDVGENKQATILTGQRQTERLG